MRHHSVSNRGQNIIHEMIYELIDALKLFPTTRASGYDNSASTFSDGRRIVYEGVERVLNNFLPRNLNDSVSVSQWRFSLLFCVP